MKSTVFKEIWFRLESHIRTLAIVAGCFALACSPAQDGDDPPSTGNRWIVTPLTGCEEAWSLKQQADFACAPYGLQPAGILYGPPCLSWYIGIGGPYAVPGVSSMEFTCT